MTAIRVRRVLIRSVGSTAVMPVSRLRRVLGGGAGIAGAAFVSKASSLMLIRGSSVTRGVATSGTARAFRVSRNALIVRFWGVQTR